MESLPLSEQLSNILTEDKEPFLQERQEVLVAGIEVPGYIAVKIPAPAIRGKMAFAP